MLRLFFLLTLAGLWSFAYAQSAVVTQCEWFTGADPGVGNGNALSLGTPESEEPLAFSAATGSWTPGNITRVKIRCRVDSLRSGATGIWGRPTEALIAVSPATGSVRLVTQLEYKVDNGSFTPVDVADDATVNLNEIVSTIGLFDGLHRLRIRATDDLGRAGLVHDGFFVVSNTAGAAPRLVTTMEFRLDSGPFTPVNVPDAGMVNFAEILATNSLEIGLHRFDVRSVDDLGRTGLVHRAYLIVSSPFVGGEQRTLAAAEFFINVDPGEGNGVPIDLPQDGTWDEAGETTDTVLTNLPVGLHLLGLRVQDDAGRWSRVVSDSILVGPILVVHSSGNDIVLDWQAGSGIDQFYIYRAPAAAGPYAKIDSTVATTYTDPGITAIQNLQYYQVTFSPSALSLFRMPNAAPVESSVHE